MAENEIENEETDTPVESETEGDLSEMEPEAIEALQLLQEAANAAAQEAATSQQTMELEASLSLNMEDQGNRLELIAKETLGGVREIADYLNPIHKEGESTPKPQPLLALLKVTDMMYREIWSQRGRLRTLETTALKQAETLKILTNEISFLVNMLNSDDAET